MSNLLFETNKDIKIRSFKSSRNIQRKEGRPDRSVSNNHFSSVILNEYLIIHSQSSFV